MSSKILDSSDEADTMTDWLQKDHQIDDREFFRGEHGEWPIVTAADLKRSVPEDERDDIVEIDRYWVTYPYAFVSIAISTRDNEHRYYVVEPAMNETEAGVLNFLTTQIQTSIRHTDLGVADADGVSKRKLIREEYIELLQNYGLNDGEALHTETGSLLDGRQADDSKSDDGSGVVSGLRDSEIVQTVLDFVDEQLSRENDMGTEGIEASESPETGWAAEYGADTLCDYVIPSETPTGHPASGDADGGRGIATELLDQTVLTDYQAIKLLYYLERDFTGFQRIDPVKHDINIEEISTPGYNQPVYVYHSEFERVSTNIVHGEEELDAFISQLAQVAGKEINHRNPQVDAILSDGSRAQLTYKTEVSEKGANYTIRQFREVPFTPLDLLSWGTFSLEQLAYLWLCVQYGRSFLLAGGTATGKTTALNALSLFIPTGDKVVSIEDTRELEIPHRNWIAEMTREAVGGNEEDAIDEYALLEAALRQRPDYLLMGEVRGEEGRDLFQIMSTGHTTFSTFHASSVGEVLKRFTSDPINVPKPVFTTLDLVCIIGRQRIGGVNARRVNAISEIGAYQTDSDQVSVKDIFSWTSSGDRHIKESSSGVLTDIQEEQGWSRQELREELLKREALLSYLIQNDIRSYRDVVVAIQAFINNQEMTLSLMANGLLSTAMDQLSELKSIRIETDESIEQTINRPDEPEAVAAATEQTLAAAKSELFPEGEVDGAGVGLDIDLDIGGQGELPTKDEGTDYVGDTSTTLTSLRLSESTVAYLRQGEVGQTSVEDVEPDFVAEEETEVVALPGEIPGDEKESKAGSEAASESGESKAVDSEPAPPESAAQDQEQMDGSRGESSKVGGREKAAPRATSDSVLDNLFGAEDEVTDAEHGTEETVSEESSDMDKTKEALGELFSDGDEQKAMQQEVDGLEGYAFGGDS